MCVLCVLKKYYYRIYTQMLSTEIGTQISLAIFFLYFVLLSGDCHTLLNCDLQKYFKNSAWLKHIIVFFTIFLFTFILDWYSYDSLVVGKESYENQAIKETHTKQPADSSYVVASILQSIGIYGLFLLTCKSEGPAVGFFIAAMLVSINIIIYVKAMYPDLKHHLNNTPMSTLFSKTYVNSLIELENIPKQQQERYRSLCMTMNVYKCIFMTGVGVVCVGAVMYTRRQYKSHSGNWSTLKFVFGNGCK
jgi:hypothetical protein